MKTFGGALHRAAIVGMQDQLARGDFFTPTQILHHLARVLAVLLGIDLPSDDFAAEYIQKEVQI
jgi:hypothetical protein